jgi:outer membrane protein OmpA-like peptidoglycan-associated protein
MCEHESMRSRTATWITAASALALLVALIFGTTTLVDKVQALEQHVSALTEKVDRSAEDARAAAEYAARSSAAAAQARTELRSAETAKGDAQRDKDQALQDKAQAEAMATDAARQAEVARAETERIRKQREEELNQLHEALDRIVATRRTDDGLVMNLPESVLRFDFDSAIIRPEGRELLSRIAGVLLASRSFGLAVYGHTDYVGTAQYNLRLSEQRAQAVKDYMASAGIDPNIIVVKGYGKSSPIVAERDEASRAKNRRVEIALSDTKIQYTGGVVK